MNRFILLIFSLIFSSGLWAQSDTISLNPPAETAMADLDDLNTMPEDITGHGIITNNADDARLFIWKRTMVSVPEGWGTAVCDVNLCYFPTVDSMQFELAGGQMGTMDVHAYPGGTPGGSLENAVPGDGFVEITIYEVADPSNHESGIYYFSLAGTPVGVDDLEAAQIHLFPNPAHNYFYLSNSQELSNVKIYNVLGKQLLSTNVYENKRFDVSNLSSGIYFVKLTDDGGKTVKTMKLKKQ